VFTDKSRYAKVPTTETTNARGEPAQALTLRRLPATAGDRQVVQSGERLDLIAQARYGDATRFWHVADANTALDSRTLTAVVGDTLNVPRT
jgi:nucleoid-associated protein YgaU